VSRTLVDALDDALQPYLSDPVRRRFVSEQVAPPIAEEFLQRLGGALERVSDG